MDLSYAAIWAWIAVWLWWVWVWLGQALVWKTSIEILGMNPRLADTLKVYTLLGIALVETAMIYSLVIAFKILWDETITATQAIWAWLAMWLTAFWAWYWEGKMVSSSLDAVNRNPDNKTQVLSFMILFLALIETVAVYGIIISFQILSK